VVRGNQAARKGCRQLPSAQSWGGVMLGPLPISANQKSDERMAEERAPFRGEGAPSAKQVRGVQTGPHRPPSAGPLFSAADRGEGPLG
jgi:hypothetical protein